MKKLFLGVITFALIMSSCNKYANDFQALKDQIAALSLQVQGVTALQTQLTATTAQITALQAAVANLPQKSDITALAAGLTAAEGEITAIQTALTSLAANGATAAQITALQGQITDLANARAAADATLATTLANLQTALTTATGAQIAALQTEIENALVASAASTDANVNAQIASLQAQITAAIAAHDSNVTTLLATLQSTVNAANAATATSLADILTQLGSTSTAAQLQAAVDALTAQLAQANSALTTLLLNSAMYNGDVTITSDAEADFYFAKLSQMGIVNGNVTVNTGGLTDAGHLAEANAVLANIGAVVGVNANTYSITTGSGFFGIITSVTLNVVAGTKHSVAVTTQAGDNLTLTNLASVAGDYTIWGADVDDSSLFMVGGTVKLDYPGNYESASLASVGGDLILVDQPSNGTGYINFPKVIVGGNVGDGTNLNGTLVFNSTGTTWINLGLMNGGVITNLTANNANAITLGTVALHGLTVTTLKPTTLDLSAATTSTGPIVVSMGDGTVNLSKFNSNVAVTITGPTTIDKLNVWTAGTLTSSTATTVNLQVFEWASVPTLPAVKWLTLGGVKHNVALDTYNATLLTANVTGAAPSMNHWALVAAGVTSSGNAHLTSVTLAGTMATADLENLPVLTSVTTSGQINTFVLNNAAIITSLNLGHNAFVGDIGFGGPGSVLTITNNAMLASLAPTALDWMQSLTVTGNPALAHFDFSSYHTDIYSGALVAINIDAPATMATYTHAVGPVSAGNPGIQATITSPDIMTLKAYIVQMAADIHITSTTYAINVGTNGPSTLTADLNTDNFAFGFGYTNNVQGGGPLHLPGQLGQVQ